MPLGQYVTALANEKTDHQRSTASVSPCKPEAATYDPLAKESHVTTHTSQNTEHCNPLCTQSQKRTRYR